MSVKVEEIVVGGFYAKDNVRGRTHIREVVSFSKEDGQEWIVHFKIHNLLRRKYPPTDASTLKSFAAWAVRKATSATDTR